MQQFFNMFSTRELALITWLGLAILLMMFNKDFRASLLNLFKSIFQIKIFSILSILIVYSTALIFLLDKINLWNVSLIKDFIFWFFTVAIVSLSAIVKAKNTIYFKDFLKENLKWTVIIEFLINIYTFPFWIEFLIIPLLFILVWKNAEIEIGKRDVKSKKTISKILAILGLIFLSFILYKTIINYQDIFSIQSLLSFLLTPFLTVLLIPLLYFLVLFSNYEQLFIRLPSMIQDIQERLFIKRKILKVANVSLNRLEKISKATDEVGLRKKLSIAPTSLSSYILMKIKKDHKSLFDSTFKKTYNSFINYCLDKNQWWLIVIIVLSIFSTFIFLLDFQIFNVIKLEKRTAEIIIDQRTANIATIVGITFTVIGFLLSNTVKKDHTGYQILFSQYRLHAIIYFILSTVGCLALISTFRDHLSQNLFLRAAMVSSYMMIVVLVLIGILFKRLYLIVNAKFFEEIDNNEIIKVAKISLIQLLTKKLSRAYYNIQMTDLGLRIYNPLDMLNAPIIINNDPVKSRKPIDGTYLISDIRIKKLKARILKKQLQSDTLSFDEISIQEMRYNTGSFFSFHDPDHTDPQFIKALNDCIKLKKTKIREEKFSEMKASLNDKYEEAVKDGKLKEVRSILKIYQQLYQLEFDNKPKYEFE